MTEYSREEVKKHNKADDLWVIIGRDVYDLTKFLKLHPGGAVALKEVAGQDVTADFYGLHRADVLNKPNYKRLKIGQLKLAREEQAAQTTVAPTPFADASFWRKHSPYYKESHRRLREAMRAFVEQEIMPIAPQQDENNTYPSAELWKKMGQKGMIATMFAQHKPLLEKFGVSVLPGGVSVQEWDTFHDMICIEEFKRFLCYGWADGLYGGVSIGLPPALTFGSEELQEKIGREVMQGDKRICLAISEPYVGSDVAKIRTRAVKSADGQFWELYGTKKWITGGMFSDYFTVLARTAPLNPRKPYEGMTMMVAARDATVTTRRIWTSYSGAAGTALVEFDGTRVPVTHQVGWEGAGFLYTMHNFNWERWGMIVGGNAMSRRVYEECFKWTLQREVFGKRLIDQAVIRNKLATMAAEVETVHSMAEDLTYQMSRMTHEEVNKHLAGPIALLKYKQTRAAMLVADNACQIFGGRALTRGGMGMLVEKFQRSQKMQAILGGSEEILADFAMRQAARTKRGHIHARRLVEFYPCTFNPGSEFLIILTA
eukprot:g20292.t1